jgi:predicted nucleic acid-binding protein
MTSGVGRFAGEAPSPLYLADTSALTHLRFRAVHERLTPLIEAGLVARCGVIDLEMLFTARTYDELVAMREEHTYAFPLVPMTQDDVDRAMDVMILLAAAQQHRSAKLPDLLIASTAERAGLTMLHYDGDFDHIARVTGQPMEWVAPKGSLSQ